ncbi:MAG: hypothetical protein F4Y88_00375 [Chloroflexi bacterium]|nr:hypothetical protein [Chloroflexota bacterium]
MRRLVKRFLDGERMIDWTPSDAEKIANNSANVFRTIAKGLFVVGAILTGLLILVFVLGS